MTIKEQLQKILDEANAEIQKDELDAQDFAKFFSNKIIKYFDYKIQFYNIAKTTIERASSEAIKNVTGKESLPEFVVLLTELMQEIEDIANGEIDGSGKLPF